MRTDLLRGIVLVSSWPADGLALSEALMQACRQGRAMEQVGRYGDATPFYKRALELGDREFGPDHPTTATLLNNLAELDDAEGRYADAEPLYKRATAIDEKALGPDHPDVATGLENYAALFRKTDRNAEADTLEARAKAIRAKHARENPAK